MRQWLLMEMWGLSWGLGEQGGGGWGDVCETEPHNWPVDLGLKGDDSLIWKRKEEMKERKKREGKGRKEEL